MESESDVYTILLLSYTEDSDKLSIQVKHNKRVCVANTKSQMESEGDVHADLLLSYIEDREIIFDKL